MLSPHYKDHRPSTLMIDPSKFKNKMVSSRVMDELKVKNSHQTEAPQILISPQRVNHKRTNTFLVKQTEFQHSRKRLKLKDYLHLRQFERSKSIKSLSIASKYTKNKSEIKIPSNSKDNVESMSKQEKQDLKQDEYFAYIKQEIIQKFKKQGRRANDIQNWIFENIKNTTSSNKNEALIFIFKILQKVDEMNKIMEVIGKDCKDYSQSIMNSAKLQVGKMKSNTKQNSHEASFFWDEDVEELLSPAKIIKQHLPPQFNLLNARI